MFYVEKKTGSNVFIGVYSRADDCGKNGSAIFTYIDDAMKEWVNKEILHVYGNKCGAQADVL